MLHVLQGLHLQAGVVAGALGAVGAVLGAGAGLDGIQGAELDLLGVPVRAVDRGGPVEQLGNGQVVDGAFGERAAFIAIWLQWINTMVWYPTILSFIAGTAAYLIDPALAQNKVFLVSVILIVFWGLTLLNLRGIHVSSRANSFCGLIGLLIPMAFLIALGLTSIFLKGDPIQISFSAKSIFPSLATSDNWTSLVAIMASFLGMELSGVHVSDILNPQKNFPKAMAYSVAILLTTMMLGALSIDFRGACGNGGVWPRGILLGQIHGPNPRGQGKLQDHPAGRCQINAGRCA